MEFRLSEKCHDCSGYDTCETHNGKDCEKYEYYKCKDCVDRVVEHDEIPRCFRGGMKCMDIRQCTVHDH